MTAKKVKPEMTPAELEELRLEYERRLIKLKRDKVKAQWVTAWQTTKALMFPFVVILGIIAFVVYGALFAIIGESLKKITK
jgi:hypothetical protein